MKLYRFLLFLFTLFLALPNITRAQSAILGDFSVPLATEKIPLSISFTVDGKSYNFSRSDILRTIKESHNLSIDGSYRSEIENPNFCAYKKSLICELSLPYSNYAHVKKNYIRTIDPGKMEAFITELAQKTDTAPVNAKLQMKDGKVSVFDLSTPGIQLDKEKSLVILTNYIDQGNFTAAPDLPFKTIQPEVSTKSIDNLGITTLIGEGVSNFSGSPANRIFNIKRAVQQFEGLLIKPGEEFSFVENLGEVDGEHGYKPELVIKNDKTEPEFGGGICQVSTTAFRAAINSGLEITARRNHAYPVSYYNPQGMDATIYVPKPDLRFINNTPGYILIQTKIEGTVLTFDFYGTSDGRDVKVIGPKIIERGTDGSMKTTFTQEVYDKNGQLIRSDVFNSNYASPAKYPHPGQEPTYTQKPQDWSKKQWDEYKSAHGL